VRRNARAFFGNRLFGNLYENLLPFVQQLADRWSAGSVGAPRRTELWPALFRAARFRSAVVRSTRIGSARVGPALRARAWRPSRNLSSLNWPSFNRSSFDGPGFNGPGFDGTGFDRASFNGPGFRSRSILDLVRSFFWFAWSLFGRCGNRGLLLTRSYGPRRRRWGFATTPASSPASSATAHGKFSAWAAVAHLSVAIFFKRRLSVGLRAFARGLGGCQGYPWIRVALEGFV
jgi:hypothetical protein